MECHEPPGSPRLQNQAYAARFAAQSWSSWTLSPDEAVPFDQPGIAIGVAEAPLPTAIHINHALTMFVVTEAQAAMIRATYEQRGEISAAIELRQLFLALRTMLRRDCAADDRGLEAATQAAASSEIATR
jgi:hypothetical protein